MKKILTYSLIICLMVGIISCKSEPTRQNLEINIKEYVAKTILPQDTTVDVVKYKIEGVGPDNNKIAFETSRTSYTLEGMLIGSWSLTAYGINREGIKLVMGETDFNLSPSNTKATIELNKLVGTGELDLTFKWDSSKLSDPNLKLNCTDYAGRKVELKTDSFNKERGEASLYKTGIPSGSYTIQAELFDGEIKVSGFSEAIRIVDTRTTQKTVNMLVNENGNDNGSITLVDRSGTPVKCSITGLATSVIANEEVCVKLSSSNTALNEISAVWYLDGLKIGTGTQLKFSPKPGSHRLDVVAETQKLGSTGSTYLIFQADVLGKIGEPVKNDITINSNVNLKGNSEIAISEHNKLFISSTKDRTLQVCSIKSNILSADTTYNKDFHNFETSDISEMLYVPEAKQLYIINKSSDSIAALSYNPSTDVLTKILDNGGRYIKGQNVYGNGYQNLMYNPELESVHAMCSVNVSNQRFGLLILKTTATSNENFIYSQRALNLIDINHAGPHTLSPDGKIVLFADPVDGKLGYATSHNSAHQDIFTIYKIETDSSLVKDIKGITYLDRDHLLLARENNLTILEKDINYPRVEGYNEYYPWHEASTYNYSQGYDPIAVIANYKTGYIYIINKGSKNIVTFRNTGRDIIHEYTTDLGFTPRKALLSQDGQMLVVQEAETNKPYIFKIKQY